MLTKIPFNVEHLSCCLVVLFVFHSYDSRQKLSVSNCMQQKSKIKHAMLIHSQDKGSSSESCMFYVFRLLVYTVIIILR